MKTPYAQQLFQYWNSKRSGRNLPKRSAIEPADIRDVLADTIILEDNSKSLDYSFRLVGSRVAVAFGHDLRGKSLKTLFPDRSAPLLGRLLRNCNQDHNVVLIGFQATTPANRQLDYELILLPLRHEDTGLRILGAIVPSDRPFWVGIEPFTKSVISSIRVIDPDREPLYLANRPELVVPPAVAWSGEPADAIDRQTKPEGPSLRVIVGGKVD